MSIDFSLILQKTRRTRLVQLLKRLKKPFPLWQVIVAFAKPFGTLIRHGLGYPQLTPKLRRPLPAWSLLIMLFLGAGLGFYASIIATQVAGSGQSNAPDFTIATTPVSMTASQGSLATFAVSLASLNSFAGSVNLNYSLSPSITNVTLALNPISISLLTGSGSSTLTISLLASTPLNSYTLTVYGTNGGLSHNVTSILRVVPPPAPDFSITSIPSQMNVSRGSAASATITMSSIGGFAGTINLTTSITPSNGSSPTLTLNPNRVTVLSGGTANAILTISTGGATSPGVYSIVVLGVSGTQANSVTLTLTVQ